MHVSSMYSMYVIYHLPSCFQIFKEIVINEDQGLRHDIELIVINTAIAFSGGIAIGLGMAVFFRLVF